MYKLHNSKGINTGLISPITSESFWRAEREYQRLQSLHYTRGSESHNSWHLCLVKFLM